MTSLTAEHIRLKLKLRELHAGNDIVVSVNCIKIHCIILYKETAVTTAIICCISLLGRYFPCIELMHELCIIKICNIDKVASYVSAVCKCCALDSCISLTVEFSNVNTATAFSPCRECLEYLLPSVVCRICADLESINSIICSVCKTVSKSWSHWCHNTIARIPDSSDSCIRSNLAALIRSNNSISDFPCSPILRY